LDVAFNLLYNFRVLKMQEFKRKYKKAVIFAIICAGNSEGKIIKKK
jgi:hypothetical protein